MLLLLLLLLVLLLSIRLSLFLFPEWNTHKKKGQEMKQKENQIFGWENFPSSTYYSGNNLCKLCSL